MKPRIILVIIILALTLLLSSCLSKYNQDELINMDASDTHNPIANSENLTDIMISDTGNLTSEVTEGENCETYDITSVNYIEKDVNIKYPKISNLYDSTKEEEINTLLKNQAFAEIDAHGGISEDLFLELDYEIKWKSSNYISIEYYGSTYFESAAYPRKLKYTLNVDLINGKRLMLSNYLVIDQNFIDILRNIKIPEADELASGAYKDLLSRKSDEKLMNYLNNADLPYENSPVIYSYIGEDALGLIISVSHVAGDQVEIEIKYDDLENNTKEDVVIW